VYTFREICEIVITVIIVVTISYRVAVVYDWIPADSQPVAVIKNQYKQLKIAMFEESRKPTLLGKTTYFILSTARSIEKYFDEKEKKDKLEEQTIASCQENGIFRFFMGMGSNNSGQCIPRDNFVDKAVQGNINQPPKEPNTK